jgi:7-cyano-7-deazaguanine synthase in queuosine biosynthesis
MIKINKDKKEFHIFWTGGFDSTFLLLYFLKYSSDDSKIYPIYISCEIDKRKSHNNELTSIHNIFSKINNQYNKKLQNINIINNLTLDNEIKKLTFNFYENINQYSYIAQICKNYNIDGYIAIVRDDKNWKKDVILNQNTSEACFDLKNNDFLLFERFRVPLIKYYKKDLFNFCDDFKQILCETWSCWFPINNKQCKKCKMCLERII